MRLGCLGCLGTIVLTVLVGTLILGVIGIFQDPGLKVSEPSRADGLRSQQKLYEVLQRQGPATTGRRGGKNDAVVLTEREVNAFLSRHLTESAELPLDGLIVRLPGKGLVELAARVPLRALLGELPLGGLADALPGDWLERPLWLRLRTHPRVEDGVGERQRRYLRIDVERFYLGRQRLPAFMLRLLLNPTALRLLRWPLPGGLEGLRVEAGRVVILAGSLP